MKRTILSILLIVTSGAAGAQMMGSGMGSSMMNQKSPSTSSESTSKSPADKTKGYTETQTFCSQCHKPPVPEQHTPEEWPGVVERMQGYMQKKMMRLPESSELKLILEYLDNSKDSH